MARKWAWASVAIVSMWIAVLFTALFAPSLEATGVAGDHTSVPVAALTVAIVAFIGTIVVAVQGFGGSGREAALDAERDERERLETRIAELEQRLASQDDVPPRARARTLLGH